MEYGEKWRSGGLQNTSTDGTDQLQQYLVPASRKLLFWPGGGVAGIRVAGDSYLLKVRSVGRWGKFEIGCVYGHAITTNTTPLFVFRLPFVSV